MSVCQNLGILGAESNGRAPEASGYKQYVTEQERTHSCCPPKNQAAVSYQSLMRKTLCTYKAFTTTGEAAARDTFTVT